MLASARPRFHTVGDDAGVVPEVDAEATPVAATPQGIERWLFRPISALTRLGVVLFSLLLWCTIALPVWLFLVARAMAVIALRNVVNIYRGAGTVDVTRLEQVVLFWPRGCIAIVSLLFGHSDRGNPALARHPLEAVQETLLAIFFFTVMIFSAELAKDYVSVLLAGRDWITGNIAAAFAALLGLLRTLSLWPF